MNESRISPKPEPSMVRSCVVCIAACAALWAFTTLFFGGNIGPWNDDYFFTTRNPVTGAIDSFIKTTREPYLPPTGHLTALRPLLHSVIPTILSVCWDHFWAAHLIGAVVHGVNAYLLFVILRLLGRSMHTAAACGLLFMTWAVHHEAWLWVSAYGTLFSSMLFLLMVVCVLRMARSREQIAASSQWRGAGWGMMLTPLAAGILCFQEQASCAFPALGIAYLAACPRHERPMVRVWRAGWPLLTPCGLIPVYLLLVKRYSQPGLGTDKASYERWDRMFNRVMDVLKGVLENVSLRRFGHGAATRGWRVLLDDKPVMILWLVVIGVLCVLAGAVWARRPVVGPGAAARKPGRAWAVVAFGVCACLGSLVPIAAIVAYPTNSRVTYLPLACLIIAGSTVIDGIARLFHPETFFDAVAPTKVSRTLGAGFRVVTAGVLAGLCVFGGVMTIGAQSRMREVVRGDERNGAELRKLVPAPLANTVFLPVSVRPRPFRTGDPAFDEEIRSVWERLWSMPYFLKFQYRRDDVYSLGAPRWLPIVMGLDEQRVEYVWPFGVPYFDPATNRAPIPWEFVIPFTFDERGSVRIVTRVVQPRKDETPIVVDVPQARELVKSGRIPALEFTMPLLP